MLLELGNPKEAVAILTACSEKLLQNAGAQALLAEAYAMDGDREKALASCLATLKLNPTDSRLIALRMSLERHH